MAQVDAGLAVVSRYRLKEQGGDPANPAAGYGYLYCKPEGVFFKDDNGEVVGPFGFGVVPGGRLTLETGVPVSTSDQSAKTTLFYTPYLHDVLSLYANSKWNPVQFTQKSLVLGGYTASRVYDIFGYLNAGTLALESLIWTNSTTRATNVVYQDGRLVKSSDATRLYLGTIYINSSGGETEDTIIQRFVWNMYNRVPRKLFTTKINSHSYVTATWRAWDNDAAVRFEFVQGEQLPLLVDYDGYFLSVALVPQLGIGLDSTSVASKGVGSALAAYMNLADAAILTPSIGYHYVQGLERGKTGSTDWTDIYVNSLFWA